jgi:NAD kinase
VTLAPRVVVVTRPTSYEELLAHHATRAQAEFFLKQRNQSLAALEAAHHRIHAAVAEVEAHIPLEWRRNRVQRAELDRFLFEPEDTIVVVGQDGLVANVAKYLTEQPVIGINPTPEAFDGVLVPHRLEEGVRLLEPVAHREIEPMRRSMVSVALDDGQTLCALNELFLGHRSHQSARYELSLGKENATHSSSGVIVATGTGATGWARSIHHERHSRIKLPKPSEARLAFFVREAFPSHTTSTDLTEGSIGAKATLELISRMESGVIFGDGIESDYLRFDWGTHATVRLAERCLMWIARA